jgi:hypothetical protein
VTLEELRGRLRLVDRLEAEYRAARDALAIR